MRLRDFQSPSSAQPSASSASSQDRDEEPFPKWLCLLSVLSHTARLKILDLLQSSGCLGFSWDRIDFLYGAWYEAVLTIGKQTNKTMLITLTLLSSFSTLVNSFHFNLQVPLFFWFFSPSHWEGSKRKSCVAFNCCWVRPHQRGKLAAQNGIWISLPAHSVHLEDPSWALCPYPQIKADPAALARASHQNKSEGELQESLGLHPQSWLTRFF